MHSIRLPNCKSYKKSQLIASATTISF